MLLAAVGWRSSLTSSELLEKLGSMQGVSSMQDAASSWRGEVAWDR